MLGYTGEELLKLSFQDVTHPDDLETDLNFLNELVASKRSSYEVEKRYIIVKLPLYCRLEKNSSLTTK